MTTKSQLNININSNKAALQSTLAKQMFATSHASLIVGVLLAVILAYMQHEVIDTAVVRGWFTVTVLIAIYRGSLAFAYNRKPVDDPVTNHSRLVRFRVGALIASSVWGSTSFLMYPDHDPQHQMFLIFLLAGLTSGGVVSLSADLVTSIGYAIAVLMPLEIRLLVAGNEFSTAMFVSVMLYLGFMVITARYIHRNLAENLVLRLEATKREVEMRASEDRYRLLFNSSPLTMWVIDADSLRFIDVNQHAVDVYGYTHQEFVQMTLRDIRPAEDLPELYKLVSSLSDGKLAGELRHRKKDGTIIDVAINSISLNYGGIPARMGIVQDITERKQTEITLNHSNRALATLSAVNRNLAQATDETGLLQAICQTIVEQCGYRLAWVGYLQQDAAMTVRPVAQYGFEAGYLENAGIVWADTDRGRGPVGKAARSGKSQVVRNILNDESMLPWRAEAIKRGYASGIALPLIDINGVYGVLVIYAAQADAINPDETKLLEEMAHDLTLGLESLSAHVERDVALEQLARANIQIEEERTRLAERVFERTAQLQLANHAKDSFLATMSHEIRTPLGGLLGMMELLSLSRLDGQQNEVLEAAQKSGKSLLRIVNDILDWSKIEAGKLELAPRATTILEMLASVVTTYSQIASEKDIQMHIEIDPTLCAAHVFDPLRLSQVLNNFTSNAIKFTENGVIEISAKRLARYDDSEEVRFCVKDSGVGIAPELQQRLFQHYEQASADTARMYGGTGLGLAICQRLAEIMDGKLSVESVPGLGSTFCISIRLPIAQPTERRHSEQIQDKKSGREDETDISPLVKHGQNINILIVDDHPLNRMLLKQQLVMLGLQVESAADGTEALALWQSRMQDRRFDLIITDCHMPGMDGYELTYHIREFDQQADIKRIPIIAWTANVLAEEEVRCRGAGMDDLLTKPTELADLRATLLKWLLKSGVMTKHES